MDHGPVHRTPLVRRYQLDHGPRARGRGRPRTARDCADRPGVHRPSAHAPPRRLIGGRVTYTRCTARRETPNEPRRDIKRAIRGWIRQRQQRKCRPTPPDRPAIPRDLLAFLPICSHLGQGLRTCNHVNRVSSSGGGGAPSGGEGAASGGGAAGGSASPGAHFQTLTCRWGEMTPRSSSSYSGGPHPCAPRYQLQHGITTAPSWADHRTYLMSEAIREPSGRLSDGYQHRAAGRTIARTGGTRPGLCAHAGARAARARPQTCQPALAQRPEAVHDAL